MRIILHTRLLPRVHHADADAERDVIGALVRGTLQLADVAREDAPSLFAFSPHVALFDIVRDLLDLSGSRRGLRLRLVMGTAQRIPATRLLAGVVLSDDRREHAVGYLPSLVRSAPGTRRGGLEALRLARRVAGERLEKEARRERSREALATYVEDLATHLLATEDDGWIADVVEPVWMTRQRRREGEYRYDHTG